jgi:hypothetical protein
VLARPQERAVARRDQHGAPQQRSSRQLARAQQRVPAREQPAERDVERPGRQRIEQQHTRGGGIEPKHAGGQERVQQVRDGVEGVGVLARLAGHAQHRLVDRGRGRRRVADDQRPQHVAKVVARQAVCRECAIGGGPGAEQGPGRPVQVAAFDAQVAGPMT